MQRTNPRAGARKAPAPVRKPYLKGRAVSVLAARRGAAVFAYMTVSAILYLFLGQILVTDTSWLRFLLNLAVLGILGFLMYSRGAAAGEGDAAFAEIALRSREAGKEVPSRDLDRCFHPLKGFFTALAGALPWVLLAAIHASMAQKATYTLGALPEWLSSYERRADVGLALSYYHETVPFGFADFAKIAVRLLIFPFVNMAGPEDVNAMLLIDRLSPLLALVTPAMYGVGYTRGPALRALVHGGILSNTRRRAAKLRRERKATRREPPKLV
ncbi:MAG TPA: hypothetical protein VLA21_08595 [Candidatus Limnocylindria bacterium]|nr:hypothetical protein [Candidatus Limnocylindria bacterium]